MVLPVYPNTIKMSDLSREFGGGTFVANWTSQLYFYSSSVDGKNIYSSSNGISLGLNLSQNYFISFGPGRIYPIISHSVQFGGYGPNSDLIQFVVDDGTTPSGTATIVRQSNKLSNYYAGGGIVSANTVGYPNGVATPIPSGGTIKLSNFHGSQYFNFAPYVPLTYVQTPVISAYFDSVDREVYWAIDIKSMGSRWWTHWSDFSFNSFTFSNGSDLPGISQPELYSSVSIDTAGSSGRGGVYVYQQPSAANGWIGIINTNDNPQGSRAPYVMRINITATGPVGNFSSPNLWFNKTAIQLSAYGNNAAYSSTTLTALFHPDVTLVSISWSGASGFQLTNVNSQTVTITNPNIYDEGAYQFGTYNIRGSTLTCTAVLRVNNINYTVTKNIFVHAIIAYPPAPIDYGGWSANSNSTSEQGGSTDNSSTETAGGISNDGTELERPISPEEPINEVIPLPPGWIPPEIPVIDINDIPPADTTPPAEQ